MPDNQQQKINHPDEIDLLEILIVLWRQKLFIFFVTISCGIIAATYCWLAKPTYEAKAYLLPPTAGDITALNFGRYDNQLTPFQVNDVYEIFSRNLLAESTKKNFFNQYSQPSLSADSLKNKSTSAAFSQFTKSLTIKEIPKSKPAKYIIIARGENPTQVAAWVKSYIDLVEGIVVQEMMQIIQDQIKLVARNLKLKLDIQTKVALKQREDRLVQLREALNIASASERNGQVYVNNTVVGTHYSLEPSLMYLRGEKALQAEVKNLSTRKTDTPFLPHFRELQAQLNMYENIKINPDEIKVFRLDGEIEIPDGPVAPKKQLTLALSILIGLMLGVTLALIRNRFSPAIRAANI